jgi:hypothetical protein
LAGRLVSAQLFPQECEQYWQRDGSHQTKDPNPGTDKEELDECRQRNVVKTHPPVEKKDHAYNKDTQEHLFKGLHAFLYAIPFFISESCEFHGDLPAAFPLF